MTRLFGKVVAIASLVAVCGCGQVAGTSAAPTTQASPIAPTPAPSSVWDDRLAGLETAVEDNRLTRPFALTDDTTMGVPTTQPVTPEGSVMDALLKGERVFPSVQGRQPLLVFCALTTDTYGTVGAGNSATRKYVNRPVWAVAYHDIKENAKANSIPPVGPPRGPIDVGPLVDANVVAFVDDLTRQFLFATDDSIRRPN